MKTTRFSSGNALANQSPRWQLHAALLVGLLLLALTGSLLPPAVQGLQANLGAAMQTALATDLLPLPAR